MFGALAVVLEGWPWCFRAVGCWFTWYDPISDKRAPGDLHVSVRVAVPGLRSLGGKRGLETCEE